MRQKLQLLISEFYLCVNASNREEDFSWFKEHLPKTISLIDESDETALLALQGPKAQSILSLLTPTDLSALKYFWALDMKVAGIPCFVAILIVHPFKIIDIQKEKSQQKLGIAFFLGQGLLQAFE